MFIDKARIYVEAGNGGDGMSSLWGGNGGDDTLVGGEGYDTFIYNLGNGNDVVRGADENDTIVINTTSIDDFVNQGSALFVGNDVKFTLSDGGSFTIKNGKTCGSTYVVNGTAYVANSNGDWELKS